MHSALCMIVLCYELGLVWSILSSLKWLISHIVWPPDAPQISHMRCWLASSVWVSPKSLPPPQPYLFGTSNLQMCDNFHFSHQYHHQDQCWSIWQLLKRIGNHYNHHHYINYKKGGEKLNHFDSISLLADKKCSARWCFFASLQSPAASPQWFGRNFWIRSISDFIRLPSYYQLWQELFMQAMLL